ncbi:SOS response-associated peptidase [Gracilimonas tropica]|uniref:SOS response-associated peptidase n=1 Tax=Gracilimonas tropica TaxID=454600 RepID=UPI0003619195|nr:SOS response-associated peptidase family protein [Gracilimonas tropica]
MKRYVLEADKFVIEETFGVISNSQIMYEPNYNVIPGATMPIIIKTEEKREIIQSVWGLKFEGEGEGASEIKQEEIAESEKYLKQLRSLPCLIPISGFYKWKETVSDPLPFYLRILTRDVTAVAGLYNSFKDQDGRIVHTFAVVTMPANPLVEPLDNRMPVIIEEKDFESWLSGDAADMVKKGFSGNYLLPDMSVFRVPELVNDPSNNSKELIQPIPKLRNYDGADEDE